MGRGDENFVLLAADYSQIELRILAHLCGDKNLVHALRRKEDVFITMGAQWKKKAVCDVSPSERSQVKTIWVYTLYSLYTLYTRYTLYSLYTLYTLYTLYSLYTRYSLYTLYTQYTRYTLSPRYTPHTQYPHYTTYTHTVGETDLLRTHIRCGPFVSRRASRGV